jgi:hypothetical protein
MYWQCSTDELRASKMPRSGGESEPRFEGQGARGAAQELAPPLLCAVARCFDEPGLFQ